MISAALTGSAQQEATVERKLVYASRPFFVPHWYVKAQAGAAYDIGEAKFSQLLSPSLQLVAGYQFDEKSLSMAKTVKMAKTVRMEQMTSSSISLSLRTGHQSPLSLEMVRPSQFPSSSKISLKKYVSVRAFENLFVPLHQWNRKAYSEPSSKSSCLSYLAERFCGGCTVVKTFRQSITW
jgi:hypothetical protein